MRCQFFIGFVALCVGLFFTHTFASANTLIHQNAPFARAHVMALVDAERFVEAESVAREALQIFKKDFELNLLFGYALRMQGKLSLAAQAYERALVQSPQNLLALQSLAIVQIKLKNFSSAKSLYQKVKKTHPELAHTVLQEAKSQGVKW